MLKENFEEIRKQINSAAIKAGRNPEEITLVAVSKRVPIEIIEKARDAGQLVFGENYLQEAEQKIASFDKGIIWHFIGHLQSNKAKLVAELFDAVQTVDRLKVAKALENHLAGLDKMMQVYVQVNIGREPQKSGVLPEDLQSLVAEILQMPHLDFKGLMAMPPFFDDPEMSRPYFQEMKLLADELLAKDLVGSGRRVDLSMGMSGDFVVAIEEGATLVRVGTSLFGERG